MDDRGVRVWSFDLLNSYFCSLLLLLWSVFYFVLHCCGMEEIHKVKLKQLILFLQKVLCSFQKVGSHKSSLSLARDKTVKWGLSWAKLPVNLLDRRLSKAVEKVLRCPSGRGAGVLGYKGVKQKAPIALTLERCRIDLPPGSRGRTRGRRRKRLKIFIQRKNMQDEKDTSHSTQWHSAPCGTISCPFNVCFLVEWHRRTLDFALWRGNFGRFLSRGHSYIFSKKPLAPHIHTHVSATHSSTAGRVEVDNGAKAALAWQRLPPGDMTLLLLSA